MSTYSFEKTLSKGTQFSLDETPIENGKVRVTTDTKRLFFDLDDERFEITDFISDYSESYILNNIDNPMPKIYLSNDTFKLFKWNKITNSWDNICDNVGHADYAFKALQDENGNSITRTYAPKASPAFTGNPTAPKASGTDINSITNVDYVTNYVSDQLASLKNGMIVIVTSYSDLPTVGESGKIYLVPSSSGSGKNRYDEYIWSTTLNDYEKFGTTDIDLDGYFNSINVSGSGNAITDISVDSTNTSKLNINKGTSFLTEHPSINRTTSSREEAPTYGTKFDVVESLTMDQNGHITGYNTKKVEMVENVNHANTADSATTAASATNAEKDLNNNIISEYINNITTNGSTVVFKKGDNTDINFVVPYAETSGSSQGEVTWDAVTNKPTVFPPSNHTHGAAEIDDFADSVQGIKVNNAINADYATNAGTAKYATKASQDSNGNNIAATYALGSHNHTTVDIRNFANAVKAIKVNNAINADYAAYATNSDTAAYATTAATAKRAPWSNITGKPSEFPPSIHNHTTVDITNFTNAVKAIKVDNASTADYANKAAANADGVNLSTFVKNISKNSTSAHFNDLVIETSSGTEYIQPNYAMYADSAKNASTARYAKNASTANYGKFNGIGKSKIYKNSSTTTQTYTLLEPNGTFETQGKSFSALIYAKDAQHGTNLCFYTRYPDDSLFSTGNIITIEDDRQGSNFSINTTGTDRSVVNLSVPAARKIFVHIFVMSGDFKLFGE